MPFDKTPKCLVIIVCLSAETWLVSKVTCEVNGVLTTGNAENRRRSYGSQNVFIVSGQLIAKQGQRTSATTVRTTLIWRRV